MILYCVALFRPAGWLHAVTCQ